MGGWKEEGEAVSGDISGFKSLPINRELEMGFFSLYFGTKALILTEAVVFSLIYADIGMGVLSTSHHEDSELFEMSCPGSHRNFSRS